MNRVGHGAIVLAIALALVGSIATSPGRASLLGGGGAELASARQAVLPVIPSDDIIEGPTLDVPIRSGRLEDVVPVETLRPVAVRMAGIAVEAPVLPVGVDANNQFAVPAADMVGWYQHSSSPGAPGSSVLAAHVDYGGVPGAFFDLDQLLPGDTLEVEMEDGSVQIYEVTGNNQYDKNELPFDEVFRKGGEPVLQLITCGGTFDPVARSYEANVVVTAVPISA
ncbi:MAG: class F sortase [Actinomycetota bacterium]